MEFVLDPPHGVGPLRLGMAPDEARTALETLGPPAASTEVVYDGPDGRRVVSMETATA
jgi:hypothetical protein